MSDSKYALILAGRRRCPPLLANAGAQTATEVRHGVPLRRVAHRVACEIKALHTRPSSSRTAGPDTCSRSGACCWPTSGCTTCSVPPRNPSRSPARPWLEGGRRDARRCGVRRIVNITALTVAKCHAAR